MGSDRSFEPGDMVMPSRTRLDFLNHVFKLRSHDIGIVISISNASEIDGEPIKVFWSRLAKHSNHTSSELKLASRGSQLVEVVINVFKRILDIKGYKY